MIMNQLEEYTLIKLEPTSPISASCQEACQGQGHMLPMDMVVKSYLINDLSWPPMSPAGSSPPGVVVKSEQDEVICSTPDARTALKKKIQSDRRARGQEELVVKFRSPVKNQLTEAEEHKRERRKEQNRRAAQKCRVKKKKEQVNAHQQFGTLMEQNKALLAETFKLKNEVSIYKAILHDHEQSGLCTLVNKVHSDHSDCASHPVGTPVQPLASHVPAFSLPKTPTEEIEKNQQIEKIARMLEISNHDNECLATYPLTDAPSSYHCGEDELSMIQEFVGDEMEQFQDLSLTDINHDQVSPAGSDNAIDALENILKEGAEKRQDEEFQDIDKGMSRSRGVRNLTLEFASVGSYHGMPLSTTQSFTTSSPPQDLQIQQQQQIQIRPTDTSKPILPPLLQNLAFLQGLNPNHLNNAATTTPNVLAYDDTIPTSPLSSCTSPQSNVNSPNFFQSSADMSLFSPGTGTGCQEAPSRYLFQFPPDSRFSPSS